MSEEVYLRPLTIDDAAISWRWRNDPSIWRYTGSRPDREVTEEMEREWSAKVIADPSRMNFAICCKADNRYIGNVYIVNMHGEVGELGIFIGESSARGHGYGVQVLRLLKEEAKKRGVSKILIDVAKDNIPAIIIYLKSGARFPNCSEGDRMQMSIAL